MKKTVYGEHDYRFGQIILDLRNKIGLTQAGLATHLAVSRRAVGEWEAANSYPKAKHLKALIALALKQQAFTTGHEAEEIRVLWQTAQQRAVLDERWLSTLIKQQSSSQGQSNVQLYVEPEPVHESTSSESLGGQESLQGTRGIGEATAHLATPAPNPPRLWVDWGDALAVPAFYGRQRELAQLSEWVVQQHCRVVGILGMGGIGKSALSVSAMHQEAKHFDVVLFRSLRDAPSCEALLDDCLQVLSPQEFRTMPAGQEPRPVPTEQRISLLLSYLRKVRVLLVLDNLECLLEVRNPRGRFRSGFEGYGQLLRQVAETVHQSCLLFTSREKPTELRLLEGKYTSVRSLRLAGLDVVACQQILEEKGIASTPETGTSPEQERFIGIYGGNPLALKIVAQTIVNLFDGELTTFLAGGTIVFGGVTDLLDEQFARLSVLEQTVLYWLAIVREPVTFDELQQVLVTSKPHVQLLEAIDSLYRRSLIERGKHMGSFTLQSVVLEYVTAVLVAKACREIQQHRLDTLIEHGLSQATAREYVRQAQERLLLAPLLADLQSAYLEQIGRQRKPEAGSERGPIPPAATVGPVEDTLLALLDELRGKSDSAQGYGPANLIALLRLLRDNLSNLDLSQLCIRRAYLQGTEMQDTKLSGAWVRDCLWTSAVNVAWTVAISLDGKWWASGGIQGQVHVWEGVRLHLVWQAHTDLVYALAFSPDSHTLASGSSDGTVKLWDLTYPVGAGLVPAHAPVPAHALVPAPTPAPKDVDNPHPPLLWTGKQYFPLSLAFSPDGHLLASGGNDATVRLWDSQSGTTVQTLTHPSYVWAVAWSPDGSLLACGCVDGEIRLWERQKGTTLAPVQHLPMQTNWITSLAFAPDGRTLASTSWGDQTVKLWEVGSHGTGPRGQLLHTLLGYTDQSRCVAWSPDGRTLAYSNPDKGILLWDMEESRHRVVLYGHSSDIYGMAFTPDGARLLSGSADGTLRVWDVISYRCVRVMQGYGISLYDLAWSPDGTHLVSGNTNGQVTIWDIRETTPPRVLQSHTWHVEGVGWSPDGQYFSSCGLDGVLSLWNPTTHTLVQRFENSRAPLLGMAWSPNGNQLACGAYRLGIQIWDATTRSIYFIGQAYPTAFWGVAWSPNGTQLAGGGDDGCVYLWECKDRSGQIQDTASIRLLGHHNRVMGVAWSPDGKWLASGSSNRNTGELFVWDIHNVGAVACPCPPPNPIQTFEGHHGMVYALAWGRENQLISGGSDGILRWWDIESGECVSKKEAHQGIIRALKVSPDGNFLASAGEDGAIMIWDLTRNAHLQTLRRDRPYERLNITGIKGLNPAQITSLRALGAIENALTDVPSETV